MDDKLETYRSKRSARRTPEPVPAPQRREGSPSRTGNSFVIQEHHARALHWDFRLERDGVLVSWSVPKGIPLSHRQNRLAVQTEDHPLDYATFEGRIPAGEYGGGSVTIWDRGHYECEKWDEDEIIVVLHGDKVEGRYVLFRTDGKNWMLHRMDPTPSSFGPLPTLVRPMLAVPGALPTDDERWGYEFKWDGVRAVAYVEGGRVRLLTRNEKEATHNYPEIRGLGEQLGSRPAVLDGEIVAFDENGHPSFSRLQPRMHIADATRARRLAESTPVEYLIFDVMHVDGRDTVELSYRDRRRLLDSLDLNGAHWNVPPWYEGGGADVLRASQEQSLEGVVAKRLSSTYQPGKRSPDWRKVKNFRTQEVVVGGWSPGKGRRSGSIGALLLGVPGPSGLQYVGKVGTGFTDTSLQALSEMLAPLQQDSPPFSAPLSGLEAADANWVRPTLVGEVSFSEWTKDRRLRQPSWRGLRPDKDPGDVVRES